jgi:phosphohistidine swiveling domain-containing protein
MRDDPTEADTRVMNDMVATHADADLAIALGSRLVRCRLADLPDGTWEREFHLDAPVSPAMEPLLSAFGRGFGDGFATWGYPIAGVRQLVVDGWLYSRIEPLLDPVEVGRRIARADGVADLVDLQHTAEHWVSDLLPVFARRRRAVADRITGESATSDLVDALVDAVTLAVEFAESRFRDVPAVNLLTAAFLLDAVAAGMTRTEATAALVGSSSATSQLAEDVTDEPLSTDLAAPLLGELASEPPSYPAGRMATPEPTPVVPHLEVGLAAARLAQDVRERSRAELSRMLGTIHRASLELGTRLASAGALDSADDVWFLAPDELVEIARDAVAVADRRATFSRERAARVRSRRHEYELAAASMPAPLVGDPPTGPPPSLDGLPDGAARLFQLAMAWIEAMNGGPPPGGDGLRGIGASAGVATGVVRVVRHAEDVLAVEPGDVLVCATTTPAWCVAIATAAAVVTESGGDLSHPAITAREFGIPAVVGVAGATTTLRDGDLVTVDGTAGTVRHTAG